MDSRRLMSLSSVEVCCSAFFILTSAVWIGAAGASQAKINWAEQLEYYGFSVESDEAINNLLENGKSAPRLIGLLVIKERYGEDAARYIELFLSDEHSGIRSRAAKMLADMGSDKGRARMKSDFRRRVPVDWEPSDTEIFDRFTLRRISTMEVVDTAAALAKLGDADVATFVQAAALHSPSVAARCSAVEAIAILMRTVDAEELKKRGVDPSGTLIDLARKEDTPAVLYAIHGEMGKEDVPPDVAEPILVAVQESPYLKRHEKQVVANDIAAVRLRRQAATATRPAEPAVPTTQPTTSSFTITTSQPSDADTPTTRPAAP